MMFVLGGYGMERIIPVGASFRECHGVRNGKHDSVAAILAIPVGRNWPKNAVRAAVGASQPAVAVPSPEFILKQEFPAEIIRSATDAALQSAATPAAKEHEPEPEQPAGTDEPAASETSPMADFAASNDELSEDEEVGQLHEQLREAEEDEDIEPQVHTDLHRILFKTRP